MKATGIVRRIDDLGRVVIPKEIRRTMRIREGDPLQTSWNKQDRFCAAMLDLAKRKGWDIGNRPPVKKSVESRRKNLPIITP